MKGIVKKIIVLTLCMALVVGSFQMNVMAKRTPKPKLNKKNITIMMGKTSRLKLKNNKKKVKWRSLNKKIVTVTKKGLVKGKSEGKTTIVAKVGKKKYKCKVRVRDPKKVYINLDYDKKREYIYTVDELQWVNNVLTKVSNVHAEYLVFDMSYSMEKNENGRYNVIVNYTIKRTYDYAGKNAGTEFSFLIDIYREGEKGGPSRAIVGSAYCKTNEVYQGQTIIEDLGPGQYNIGISSYGE